MKLISIKYFLLRCAILFSCFFLTGGFITSSRETKFLNAETILNVLQENGGITVSVKTSKNINIRFYMFTVDGSLIKELNMYGSKKISITQLERGIYIYDFFSNDERLKNGKIELR